MTAARSASLGARVLDGRRDYSYGDGGVMRMAGWVGAGAGAALATLGEGSSRNHTEVASAMVGSVVGLAVGDRLVRGTEFTFGQSVVVDLTTVGVGLMGLGVGFVLTSDQNGDAQIAVQAISSSLGSILRFRSGLFDRGRSGAGGERGPLVVAAGLLAHSAAGARRCAGCAPRAQHRHPRGALTRATGPPA